MPKRIKVDRLVGLGFGLFIGCFVITNIYQKSVENKLMQQTQQVTSAFEIEADLKELLNILLEAENNKLLYLLTGENQNDLTQKQAETELNNIIKELEGEIVDLKQKNFLEEVKILLNNYLSNSDEVIENFNLLRKDNIDDYNIKQILSEKQTQTMSLIRIKMSEMVKRESEILEEREKIVESSQNIANIAVFGGVGFVVILGLLVYYLIINLMKQQEKNISNVVNIIASSSTEIAATVEEQERVSTHQASSVNQTTTTINELAASSNNTAEQINLAAENASRVLILAESSTESATEVLNLAEGGTQKVTQTLAEMSRLKEKVEAIAAQIIRLNQQTREIVNITSIVSDLANQTNMLALNAAVEAVRAGEKGKGFGVIATQIRQLADQSKNSTEKINRLIFNIQEAMNMSVTVTEDGKRTADASIKISQETGEAFLQVAQAIKDVILKNQQDSVEAIHQVVIKSQQIAKSSQQQAIATAQVLDAMNSINQGAAENATGIRETKIGIEKLNEAAINLQKEI